MPDPSFSRRSGRASPGPTQSCYSRSVVRTLALVLALVLAPQAALASVAAFPETALRGDREISAIRVGSTARQLAETRQETACFYDANASAMTDDPINHRDPTGRIIDITDLSKNDRASLITALEAMVGRGLREARNGILGTKLVFDEGRRSTRKPGAPVSEVALRILAEAIESPNEARLKSGFIDMESKAPVQIAHAVRDAKDRKARKGTLEGGTIFVDSADVETIRNERARKSFGLGPVFFHELLHLFGFADPPRFLQNHQLGEVDTIVDQIRRELGLPTRGVYGNVRLIELPNRPSRCEMELIESDGTRITSELKCE